MGEGGASEGGSRDLALGRKRSASGSKSLSRNSFRITPGKAEATGATAVPLSRLGIWERQRRYFDQTGIEAWRRNQVPSYVTTNPYIANTYAKIVRTFLEAGGQRAGPAGHGREPAYVIELGAGSGRFAHHFLTQFHGIDPPLPRNSADVRYVMTDISAATIDFWRASPAFAPYLAAGLLDFARFDTGTSAEMLLEASGERIGPGSTAPLVVIANYVFDGIPQDAFAVSGGSLYECHAAEHGRQAGPPGDGAIPSFGLTFARVPCGAGRYPDPSWNAALAACVDGLSDGAFLFPTEALACLSRLRAMTTGPILVLSCDRGHTRPEDFAGAEPPQPLRHGSFSFPVNYHALLAWSRQTGGLGLAPERGHASIAVVALAFGLDGDSAHALARAYDREVRAFGPDDFFMLKKAAEGTYHLLDLPQAIALLRLSRWDPAVLAICYDRLVELIVEATPAQRADLRAGFRHMWRQYLYLGEAEDLAFDLGSLLAGMGYGNDARDLFRISLERHGEDPATLENLARCEAAPRDPLE